MQDELDCTGLPCPRPVMECRRLLEERQPDALTVVVDNAAASENVTRFLDSRGYAADAVQNGAASWRISARKRADAPACAVQPAGASARTLVFLPAAVIGQGNDELGAKLMGNFLATLPELGERLWRVVLVNGGVRLAATPGKALDCLKQLEAAGVSILVCGTCLEFYGLLASRQVGQTTNMLDIVTSLDLADKVIRP